MAQISSNYKGWLIVVAIGLSAVAIGAIADFLIKKDEIKWLHNKLLKLSEALTNIPLREWQVKIARTGMRTIEFVHKYGLRLFRQRYEKSIIGLSEYISHRFNLNLDGSNIIVRIGFFFGLSTVVFVLVGCLIMLLIPLSFTPETISAFIFVVFGWTVILNIFLVGRSRAHTLEVLLSAIFSSAVVTSVSLRISEQDIPFTLLNSRWYELVDGNLQVDNSLLLYCFNYPFDLATIVVSILLLRFVIKHKRFIGIVASIDIVISALLTVMLYSFLLMIENTWDILHLHVYFTDSLHWFRDVIVAIYHAAKYNEPFTKHLAVLRDIHLLPILLTTFVPVALYMSVFILISFCKPVLRLAGRIFGAVGEKEELVFKQFGFLIAAIMAAVKAIYEVLTL